MLEEGFIRKIIHIDMDAFYASVEQLDNPDLLGKPVAVGGSSKRGVVAAASYEARKYGVRSAMSSVIAKDLCPELIFIKPRFERYRGISDRVRSVFYKYTDLVEPLSLDEAYLDVTENKTGNPSATLIAKAIRDEIREKTGLTASAGISVNKFMAKIASDIRKPDGQTTIPPEEVIPFLENLDVKKFYGVGKVTREKLYLLGIFTGKDLKEKSLEFLEENFGKNGKHFYNIVRGIQKSEVKPHRIQKSLASEHTFTENISSEVFMTEHLEEIAEDVENRLRKRNLKGRTVTLKIRYNDFSIHTRSKTFTEYLDSKEEILATVKELLYQSPLKTSVRLLGISISNLNSEKQETEKEEPIAVQLQFEF